MSRKSKANRVDPVELVVLAVFAATSVWVLALGLWWTITGGRIWTGVNGVYVQDVTQYLAWIRDASRHVLVSDLFVLRLSPHDYLQPAIAISGGLVAIGMAPWLALALWQPVAVGGTFIAIRSLVHGQLSERLGRRAALVLALFGLRSARSRTCGCRGGRGDTYSGCCRWRRWSLRCSCTSARSGAPPRCGRRRCLPGSRAGCTMAGGGPGADHRGRGNRACDPTRGVAGGAATTQPLAAGASPGRDLAAARLLRGARPGRSGLAARRGVARRSGPCLAGVADACAAADARAPRIPAQAGVVHRGRRPRLATGRVRRLPGR